MSREATEAPAMPEAGRNKPKARLLLGTDRKRSRLNRTRQDLWDDTSWSNHRLSRVTSAPRRTRARGTAHGRSEASPENAARERTRVKTLRQAFLALQAALPAVPPDTKLSKLDVLVLATSYIAHLTRTLGHELPGPAWPPFLRGLRYLHPLKKWPMRSRLYAGGLGCSGPESTTADSTTTIATDHRSRDAQLGSQVSVATDSLLASPVSPALGNE